MEDNSIKEKNKRLNKLKQQSGFILFGATILYFLVCAVFIEEKFSVGDWASCTQFILYIAILTAAILVFDFTKILFDPQEQEPNPTKPKLVKKLRFRAILFNNIAILLFLFTFVIIIMCLYIFMSPYTHPQKVGNWINNLTLCGGAVILLIFLVQIFFNVFKYTLRVAAFYNARADAIEFVMLDESKDLEKLMDTFTPDKYDISNLEKIDLMGDLLNSIKGKTK